MKQHDQGPSRKVQRQVQMQPRRERQLSRAETRTYPDVTDAPTTNTRIAQRWFGGQS